MSYVIVAAIFFGAGFYAGGHPDQIATRAGLFAAWIKSKLNKGKT